MRFPPHIETKLPSPHPRIAASIFGFHLHIISDKICAVVSEPECLLVNTMDTNIAHISVYVCSLNACEKPRFCSRRAGVVFSERSNRGS